MFTTSTSIWPLVGALSFLALAGCAGPDQHRALSPNATASSEAALRPPAGTVLAPDDPLAVAGTQPDAQPMPDSHHHHHQSASPPALESVDPVCGMKVAAPQFTLTSEGKTFPFCSTKCRDTFLASHPEAK